MNDLFGEMPINLIDQIREVDREIAMRRNCYPRWVATGRMTQEEADRRIRNMEAVRATFSELEKSGHWRQV
jgi:hypothetical protein